MTMTTGYLEYTRQKLDNKHKAIADHAKADGEPLGQPNVVLLRDGSMAGSPHNVLPKDAG